MRTFDFHELLITRAGRAGITVSRDLETQLEVYFRLLDTWNRRMNLTSLPTSDPTPEAVDRLLIEPLAAATLVPAGTRMMLDVGSGNGSPAVPMALALRNAHLIMVESKTKKSVFLREVTRVLALTAEVFTARLQHVITDKPELRGRVDLVTLRAVRLDSHLANDLGTLLSSFGQLFLFGYENPPGFLNELSRFHSVPLMPENAVHLHIYTRRST